MAVDETGNRVLASLWTRSDDADDVELYIFFSPWAMCRSLLSGHEIIIVMQKDHVLPRERSLSRVDSRSPRRRHPLDTWPSSEYDGR